MALLVAKGLLAECSWLDKKFSTLGFLLGILNISLYGLVVTFLAYTSYRLPFIQIFDNLTVFVSRQVSFMPMIKDE